MLFFDLHSRSPITPGCFIFAKTTPGGSYRDKEVTAEPISISSLWLTLASNLEQVMNPSLGRFYWIPTYVKELL